MSSRLHFAGLITCALLATCCFFGCGNKGGTGKSASATSSASTQPLAPTDPSQAVAPPAGKEAGSPETLAALTQGLRRYAIEHHALPGSFQELATAGYVRDVPAPPDGKRFDIDRKAARVVLVRK